LQAPRLSDGKLWGKDGGWLKQEKETTGGKAC